MNKNGFFTAVTTLLVLCWAILPAQAALPKNFDISDNYYNGLTLAQHLSEIMNFREEIL